MTLRTIKPVIDANLSVKKTDFSSLTMTTQRKPANDKALSISPAQLEQAFIDVSRQRRYFPADADIWDLRRHWPTRKIGLLAEIRCGDYRFAPQHRLCKKNGQIVHLWAAEDAVVIKLLSVLLQDKLTVSPSCVHVKGHGGLKRAVTQIQAKLGKYRFVCKTDVKGYYQAIDQPLQLAAATVSKHVETLHRLYEQQIRKKASSAELAKVLGQYRQRWRRWCTAGLGDVVKLAAFWTERTLNADLTDPCLSAVAN